MAALKSFRYRKIAQAWTVCSFILPDKAREPTHLGTIPRKIFDLDLYLNLDSLPVFYDGAALPRPHSFSQPVSSGPESQQLLLAESFFLFVLHYSRRISSSLLRKSAVNTRPAVKFSSSTTRFNSSTIPMQEPDASSKAHPLC
jgi:hypothetical protein